MDRFIERVCPYKELNPLHFDLRGYAAYIKEHNIPWDEIDENIYSKFRLD